MNIQTLNESISEYQIRVVDSGFKRDLEDYINSLNSNQNNIIALREIARSVNVRLKALVDSDLSSGLRLLLPASKVTPFTDSSSIKELDDLVMDAKITLSEFFKNLSSILSRINSDLSANQQEITRISKFIAPYIDQITKEGTNKDKATLSIVLKDKNTISSLKNFSKNISAWNRSLPLYCQLVGINNPSDIEIVEIQNGSIDVVINLDFDVTVNLVELFEVGFKCYVAYLTYKKMLKPITEAYFGNKKLISSEDEREQNMLENIGIAIKEKLQKQIESSKLSKCDNPEKVAKQIVNLIASHIIKGNDIKLLSLPANSNQTLSEKNNKIKEGLSKLSIESRVAAKALNTEELQKLLTMYGEVNDNNEPSSSSVELKAKSADPV